MRFFLIKENIVIPTSILIDERRFTYQERVLIYFWSSRSLSHDFNFNLSQYATFRGFPDHSCASNLRSILKRLTTRGLLIFSINKDEVFVKFDQSFNLDLTGSMVYIKKNEVNALQSVVSLRIFEILCCISTYSYCVKVSVSSLKKMIGINPSMYGINSLFYSRLIKPSLENISSSTRIKVTSYLEEDYLTFYVLSNI